MVAFFSRKGYLSFQVLPKVYFSVQGLVQPLCWTLTQETEHRPDYQPQWRRGCLSDISSTLNL